MPLLPLVQHKQAGLALTEGSCCLLGIMIASSLLLLS